MLFVVIMIKIIFQVSKLRKAFTNGSSAKIKLSKTQLHKITQLSRFLCRLQGPLLKAGLPLIRNEIKSIGKRVLIPLALTSPASAIAIHKKMFGSSRHPSDLAPRH